MKQPAIVWVVRRNTGATTAEHKRRLQWGLSARLPRWHAFDGRRSRVAINDEIDTEPHHVNARAA